MNSKEKQKKVSFKDWHLFYKVTVPGGLGAIAFCAVCSISSLFKKEYPKALLHGLCALSIAGASCHLILSAHEHACARKNKKSDTNSL